MTYELLLKQTFRNQLRALPKDQRAHILEKIDVLYDDPTPDGSLKKKIHQYKKDHIYRLRAGDYRILYTYGEGWVKLLWVEHRKTVYDDVYDFDDAPLPPEAFADVDLSLETPQTSALAPTSGSGANDDLPLPTPIDTDLLTRLGVPQEFFAPLCACKTLNDLVTARVSEDVRTLIFDAVSTPHVGRVLQQPEYVVPTGDDLMRFKEGDLVDFLLKLSPEQEKVVTWGINATGPTLVKGGPGSGKSTVALYRIRELLKALRAAREPKPRILFTTYTNALVTFSRQLLNTLLREDAECVVVRTADSLAREITGADKSKLRMANQAELRQVMRQAIRTVVFEGNALQKQAQAKTINTLDLDYLIEEINDVIEARQITTLEAYIAASRPGRTVPLNETQRTAVWQVRAAYLTALAQVGFQTWQQMRARAEEIVRNGGGSPPYDAVLVDEAQDLDPSLLRMLIGLCRSPNRLFITADANQSIYGSGFRWSDVHDSLQFKGRTGILRANYRSTREIGEASHAYLGSELLDDEQAERFYINNGPQPVVRSVSSGHDEVELLARFFPLAARESRLGLGACALICPTKETGQTIAAELSLRGLEATFMTSQELDLAHRGIKVMTLKSSKGLEFPIVALAGFLDKPYPIKRSSMSNEEWEELLARERRTLFVAMTRAMRALLVIVPAGNSTPLLNGFDRTYWNME